MVQLHEQGDSVRFSFGFGLTVPIRGGWRVELSRWWLRQKYVKRSRISFSWTTALAWTNAAKYIPPTPTPPVGEADDIYQKNYDQPIPSRNSIPDDYECDDNENDETKEKVAPRTLHPRPLLSPARQMIVPRGIKTNPSLP